MCSPGFLQLQPSLKRFVQTWTEPCMLLSRDLPFAWEGKCLSGLCSLGHPVPHSQTIVNNGVLLRWYRFPLTLLARLRIELQVRLLGHVFDNLGQGAEIHGERTFFPFLVPCAGGEVYETPM